MPYVPTRDEQRALRAAIDRASFSEGERIAWLLALCAVLTIDAVLIFGGASWVGIAGAIGGFGTLYWRLRGGHVVAPDDAGLHGLGLRTRQQRAFTGLMFRHMFTGRNPMAVRVEHDPFKRWEERAQAGEGSSA